MAGSPSDTGPVALHVPPGPGRLQPIRVVVVDDEPYTRFGLRMLLTSADILVVGEAADGAGAIRTAQELAPDVMLLDLGLPDMSGLEVLRAVRGSAPGTLEHRPHFIAVTGLGLEESLFPVLRAGFEGYVVKDTPDSIVPAVRAVAAGAGWVDPLAVRPLIQEVVSRPVSRAFRDQRLRRLSRRELEVLDTAAQGYGNERIAQALHISQTTVKSHMSSILLKLDVQGRTAAVILYLRDPH